ncbi:MAG: RNA-binding protein [Leptolyngbya sp. SIO4C1]|nr:RNA-binding protein [Leptolyngbya sp. SIO4C1]
MSVRLYVGNLPKELQREEFESVFAEESEGVVSVKLITDRKTGKCRGFGFVTVKSDEVADVLVEKYNGYQLQETSLKVEKALPRSKNEDDADAGGGRRNSKKSRKGGATAASNQTSIQPDPRWAQELEKLKELLATQTTAS